MFILSLLARCTRPLSQKWRGIAKLCLIASCLVRLTWNLHIVLESDLPNLPNLHSNLGYCIRLPHVCIYIIIYMHMVDTDVNCIHVQHIEKSFSHLCHDSSLRSSSCHQLYDTKQRSLMGSCMVQSSTANLHESTTPVSVRDMRWHSQLLVACRSGKVLVEQWPPLRRQSAEAPSNQNNVTAVELNSQSVSSRKCNSLFRGDWEEDQMHGKGVWCSDGLNMTLSGANCHAFVRVFFHAELWCFTLLYLGFRNEKSRAAFHRPVHLFCHWDLCMAHWGQVCGHLSEQPEAWQSS